MTKPGHHIGDLRKDPARRQGGPVDQDDRQAQNARGFQFGGGACATGVLGDDMADAMFAQQGKIAGQIKGATGDDGGGIGQGQGAFGRINQAQQVMVLWLGGKGRKRLFADGQKHPRRAVGQGGDRGRDVGNVGPAVTGLSLPRRALQHRQRHIRLGAGRNGIAAHLRGERVGGVNDMADAFRLEIGHQPRHPAKAADPDRQRLRHRRGGTACIGIDRFHPRAGKGAGQQAGLGGAAQKKDACHG